MRAAGSGGDDRPRASSAPPVPPTGAALAMLPGGERRYGGVAVVLHWVIGLALVAQFGFGLALDELAPRATPARGAVVNLHKSIGIVLGLAIVLRGLWRLRRPPEPWPDSVPRRRRLAAGLGHAGLHAMALAVPLLGYLASNFSRHGVRFFGQPWQAWGPDQPATYALLSGLHAGTAWALAALVVGHAAIGLAHRRRP